MSSLFLEILGAGRIYPLTDRRISRLSHAEQVVHLSQRGIRLVQLREKVLAAREFYAEAAEAMRVARQLGVRVIINDRLDIALALKADGVHLGQTDWPADAARRLLGPDVIIGISTHNVSQAKQAVETPVDYVAIGPIFQTVTKQNSEPTVGLHVLKDVRGVIGDMPLVAIGGIRLSRRQEILDYGADALAVIGDLWTG